MKRASRKRPQRNYPAPDRIALAMADGTFHSYYKLVGLNEIAWFFQWSVGKLQYKMNELSEAGVVFRDNMGGVFQSVWCSYPELILRYVSLCGKAKRHI